MSEFIQDVVSGRGRGLVTAGATIRAESFDKFESLRKKEAARPSMHKAKLSPRAVKLHVNPVSAGMSPSTNAQRSSMGQRSPGNAPAAVMMAAAGRAPRSRL